MESCFWTYGRVGAIQIQLFMKFLEVDSMSLLFGLMYALHQYKSNLLGKIICFKINSSHFGHMISVTTSQVQIFMICRMSMPFSGPIVSSNMVLVQKCLILSDSSFYFGFMQLATVLQVQNQVSQLWVILPLDV